MREVSDPLTGLVKKIDDKLDEAAGKRAGGWALGAYVIFCNDSAGLDERLRKVARKEAFKRVALCIDTPAGPVRYEVAKDAEVTVVIYQKRRVVANFALKKGELDEAKGKDIVEALAKALP